MDKLISLCMIVKNEENHLSRCLDSVHNLVDEIIIVDTGSTDRTKEIAKNYTPNIYDFEWTNDFSAARNESIKHAACQWILWLDADEYAAEEGKENLRQYLSELPHDKPRGFILPIYNFTGKEGKGNIVASGAARIILRHHEVYFDRAIHEQPYWNNEILPLERLDFSIYHTGYTEEDRLEKDKLSRNMSIFEELKSKSKLTDYDRCTLGNEYMITKDYTKAIYYYERVYKPSNFDWYWFPHMAARLIIAYFSVKRYNDTFRVIEECIAAWPHHPDFYGIQGYLLEQLHLIPEAVQSYERAVEISNKASQSALWLISPNIGTINSFTGLNQLYIRTQFDLKKTIYSLSKTIQIRPKDEFHLGMWIQLLLQNDSVEEVIDLLNKYYEENPENLIFLLQVSINVGHPELCRYYFKKCHLLPVKMSSALIMTYALITDDRLLFNNSKNPENQPEENTTIHILGAFLWKDAQYLEKIDKQQSSLVHELKKMFTEKQNKVALKQEHLSTVSEMLIRLFKYGHYESYDRFIQQISNEADIANLLGDYFFHHHQLQLAFDYYSKVLSAGACLTESGYENVARLLAHQGDMEQAEQFMLDGLRIHDQSSSLRVLYVQTTKNKENREIVKEQLVFLRPEYRGIPHLKNKITHI